MSSKWPRVRLGEVLALRELDTVVLPAQEYQFAGVYSFGRGVFRGQRRLGSEFSYPRLTRLREGDFVYPKLMAWEGAFGVVPAVCAGCYVSPEFPVFEADPQRVMPSFLGYQLQAPGVWGSIAGTSSGTNVRRRRLYPDELLRAELPLPTLAEQRRIVGRIEELAAKIQEARGLREDSAQQVRHTLMCMARRADLSDEDRVRLGWRRVQLGACITQVGERRTVQADEQYPNFGIYSFGRGLFRKQPIDGSATSASALWRVKTGQFIYSRLFAFEGAYGVVGPDFDGSFVSNEYPTFECDRGLVGPEFLAAYFSIPDVWTRVASGSKGIGDRRQRVQPARLLSHLLWVPPLSWQDTVAAVQLKAIALQRLQVESAAELDALMPAILDRAFKGKL